MMENKKRNIRSQWKHRLRNSLIWILILFSVTILLVVIFLSLFPSQKAGILLSNNLSIALQRPVEIERVSYRPWRGLEIRNLKIGIGIKSDSLSVLHISRLGARFRFPALIRGRLDVTAVLIENPALRIESVARTKTDLSMKAVPSKIKSPGEVKPTIRLPVSLGLFNLELKDFSLKFSSEDSEQKTKLELDGVQFNLSGLQIPRDPVKSIQHIRGRIRLSSQSGKFLMRSNDLVIEAKTWIDLDAHWQKNANWILNLRTEFKPVHQNNRSAIQLQSYFKGQGLGEMVHIDTTILSVDSIPLVAIAGEIRHLDLSPTFEISIDGSVVPAEILIQTARDYLIKPVQVLNDFSVEGHLNILDGEISGHRKSVSFDLGIVLDNLNLQFDNAVRLNNFTFNNRFQGDWDRDKNLSGQTKGFIRCGTFYVPHHDKNWVSDRSEYHWEGEFVQSAVPVQAFIRGESHLGDGDLKFCFNWKSGKNFFWNAFQFSGEVLINSVVLTEIPDIPPGFNGIVNTQLNLNASSVTDIHLLLNSQAHSVQVPGIKENLSPIHLSSDLSLKTDSTFQFWHLKRGEVQVDSIFTGEIAGIFNAPTQQFQASLLNGCIHNRFIQSRLYAFAPQLKDMAFDGCEKLNLKIQGNPNHQPRLSGTGSIQFEKGKLYWPEQGLHLNGVAGRIHFKGSNDKYQADLTIQVDSCAMEALSPNPINQNLITCRWDQVGTDSLWLNDIHIAVPSFGIQGTGRGYLSFPQKAPTLTADMDLILNPDNMILKDSLILSGGGELSLKLWQFDFNTQQGHLSGRLNLNGFEILKDRFFSIHNLSAAMPFSLNGNLKSKQFIKESAQSRFSTYEYENQQSLYRQLVPSIGHLSFDSVKVAGYTIHSTEMDLHMASGSVHIPQFNCRVFEGNVGGSLLLSLEDEWKDLSYEIRAQAARIQSAEFLPFEKEKKSGTELNATMSFKGKGIDFERGVEINGSFHITQMGPRFASTMLEAMDPNGTDRSIRLTKRLIALGWKPQLFSLSLQHGYVYPSITLSQPWFSPLRIPKNWEYSRLALAFFVERMFSNK